MTVSLLVGKYVNDTRYLHEDEDLFENIRADTRSYDVEFFQALVPHSWSQFMDSCASTFRAVQNILIGEELIVCYRTLNEYCKKRWSDD